MAWQSTFQLPKGMGHLDAKLSQARMKDGGTPVLVLELKAQGIGEKNDRNSLLEWFEVGHEWIVRGFADLTSTNAQVKLWGLETG